MEKNSVSDPASRTYRGGLFTAHSSRRATSSMGTVLEITITLVTLVGGFSGRLTFWAVVAR